MIEYVDALDCELHPDIMVIVMIDNDGRAHTHRHCTLATMTRALSSVVDECRADLLRAAAGGDAA